MEEWVGNCIFRLVAVFCINGAERTGLAAACYQSAIITNFKIKSKFIRCRQKYLLHQKFTHNVDFIEDRIQIIFETVLCIVNI
jgi:hypothetical protein